MFSAFSILPSEDGSAITRYLKSGVIQFLHINAMNLDFLNFIVGNFESNHCFILMRSLSAVFFNSAHELASQYIAVSSAKATICP